jgi:hypothetical protein
VNFICVRLFAVGNYYAIDCLHLTDTFYQHIFFTSNSKLLRTVWRICEILFIFQTFHKSLFISFSRKRLLYTCPKNCNYQSVFFVLDYLLLEITTPLIVYIWRRHGCTCKFGFEFYWDVKHLFYNIPFVSNCFVNVSTILFNWKIRKHVWTKSATHFISIYFLHQIPNY